MKRTCLPLLLALSLPVFGAGNPPDQPQPGIQQGPYPIEDAAKKLLLQQMNARFKGEKFPSLNLKIGSYFVPHRPTIFFKSATRHYSVSFSFSDHIFLGDAMIIKSRDLEDSEDSAFYVYFDMDQWGDRAPI